MKMLSGNEHSFDNRYAEQKPVAEKGGRLFVLVEREELDFRAAFYGKRPGYILMCVKM